MLHVYALVCENKLTTTTMMLLMYHNICFSKSFYEFYIHRLVEMRIIIANLQ